MLDFSFTEEQEIFRKALREYLEKHVTPKSAEMFNAKELHDDVWQKLVENGLPGLKIPQEYGGSGADWVTSVIAIEELARADIGGRTVIPILLDCSEGYMVDKYGTEQLKKELLPKMAKGEAVLGIASTEPGCGTNFAAIKTTFKKDGAEYVINGEKQCISDVSEAKKIGGGHLVTGKTTPELGYKGMSMLYVPIDAEGVETTEFETMGLPLEGTKFNNVRVPDYHLIGEENKGVYITQEGFVCARILTTIGMVGATMKVLENGMEYLKQRQAFGRPIGSFEALQFELAEDYSRTDAARWMNYRAAWLHDQMDQGKNVTSYDVSMAASEAKMIASLDCGKACQDVLRWYGALGTTTEFDIHMAIRNMYGMSLAEGTIEAQKLVVGMSLLGREFAPYR